ncbi:MAG: post-transcriptional regulator [Bulleidia sp.]
MADQVFNTDNTLVQLVMVLKLTKLRTEQLPSLQYENLEDYFRKYLWKKEVPAQLNQAVDAVLSVTANDIVRFMAARCVIDSSHETLNDYADLIRRN